MEKLISIDFGSSYTKVAIRDDWNTNTDLLRGLSADESFSFCLPTTVACIETNGKFHWLIGEDALSQPPGRNVQRFQNWKGELFSDLGADSTHKTVAIQFFRGLLERLKHIDPRYSKMSIRICVPCLKNVSHIESQLLDILEISGAKLAASRPCIFEPEANIYGITTRGRNVAWNPPRSRNIEPNFGQMFERDKGGLFDELRRSSLKNEQFQFTILVIDVGSFSTDFGCVFFNILDGNLDEFKTPHVVQESLMIGISQLDETVLSVLDPEATQAIHARPYGDWEDIKKRIYNQQEAAIRRQKGGIIVIGNDGDLDAIVEMIDQFAQQIVSACYEFCERYDVRPSKIVMTGGGALIRGLRERVASSVRTKLNASIYDLLDEKEPYGALSEKRAPGGGWRYDPSEVDARMRGNRDLIRGGSAIGGCSVALDLPVPASNNSINVRR